jgi:hypothetical protein
MVKFADCPLHPHGATEENIPELTNLARDEQETIKRRNERNAHVVKRQSKSKRTAFGNASLFRTQV